MINRSVRVNSDRSATVKGCIYMHTSPNGKSYIGQTIQTPKERWDQHVRNANAFKEDCRILENAIRLYGSETFTHEIILITSENLLDHYETMFIDLYNTKTPNGYNLRDGGDGGCTEEMKAQMRKGNDKKIANKSWRYDHHEKVKYVVWYHETNIHGTELEGYRVSDHPNGRPKTFADSRLSIGEKYKLAVEYKLYLDSYDGYYDERDKLPMYMGRYKGTGFKVRYPDLKSKWFKTDDAAADRIAAYEYLISICPNDQFDRVFKNCIIPF